MEHHGHDMGERHAMPVGDHAGHDITAKHAIPARAQARHVMTGAGHDRHAGHSVAMFRDKFWLSLALTIPVVLLSSDVSTWLGYGLPAIPGLVYIPALLGTVVFLYGGLVFIRGARGELADRKPGMMTLISLAMIVAFVTSWAGTLGLFEVEIWWELATLIAIMLLGHWLEMRSIAQARGALSALAELLPDTAERLTESGSEEVPIAALALGDVILVRPGARVAADGVVVDGTADVDESMITGESKAVAKQPGDAVVAGTVAAGGSLRVRITAVGDATALSGIMRLVAAAQASGSRAQALADRAAAILVYLALASGQRAGLVEDDRVDRAGSLEREAILDEQAIARAQRGRDGDDEWDGQPERVGTGDDEHRRCPHERAGLIPVGPPIHERDRARAEREVKEDCRGSIGQRLRA